MKTNDHTLWNVADHNLQSRLWRTVLFVGLVSIVSNQSVSAQILGDPPFFYYPPVPRYYLNKPGTEIKPMPGGGDPVAPLGFSKTASVVDSTFGSPVSVAVDRKGNIYIADKEKNQIIKRYKVSDFKFVSEPFGSGFKHPSGVAVDSVGNVFVADQGNNLVKRISKNGDSIITLGFGFKAPSGVAVDRLGNIYVADKGNGVLKLIPKSGGSPVTICSGFKAPVAVAVDLIGNIYVTDEANPIVKKIAAGSRKAVAFGFGFKRPYGITVDDIGNVYVSDIGNNLVKKFPAGGGKPVRLGSGYKIPEGIAIDTAGIILIADKSNGALKKVVPTGGYFISSALPIGLKFNRSTGVISGTPKETSPVKRYTITAWNKFGASYRPSFLSIGVYDNYKPVNLSYPTPLTFIKKQTINPVLPTSEGVAPFGFNTKTTVLTDGLSNSLDMGIDSVGNIFVADLLENNIYKIPADGNKRTIIGAGIKVTDITVDSRGDVFVTDGKIIMKFVKNQSTPLTIQPNLGSITGIAASPSGDLFLIIDQSSIFKIASNTTKPTLFFNKADNTYTNAIAVDFSGNVYIGGFYSGGIIKILPNGVFAGALSVAGVNARSIAVDPSGNIFSASEGAPDGDHPGGTQVVYGNQMTMPLDVAHGSLAVDIKGNFYFAWNGRVNRASPVGGYFINKALPDSLVFNSATGEISGVPKMNMPSKTYEVTAFNDFSKNTAGVSLSVIKSSQAISINYQSPQNYTKGKVINPLVPSSSNVASPAYNVDGDTIAQNFEYASDLGVDAVGNIYAAIPHELKIVKIFKDGRMPVLVNKGFQAFDIAVDAAGNVYGVDEKQLKKFPANGGMPITIPSGLSSPSAVTLDRTGNLYVIEQGNQTVYKIPSKGGKPVAFANFESSPESLAIDPEGNLYTGVFYGGAVEKIPADGGAHVFIPLIGVSASHIDTDPSGNLFVVGAGSPDGDHPGAFEMFPAGGGNITITGFGGAIAVDSLGNLYVNKAGTIMRIKPAGGYFINRPLPDGFKFNTTNGIISGTPNRVNPAERFTVVAYNSSEVSASACLNITVTKSVADLVYLKSNTGILMPSFKPDLYNYTLVVPSATEVIRITPVTSDPNVYVTVNGMGVASGKESENFQLSQGANVLEAIAADGNGLKIKYLVKVISAGVEPETDSLQVNRNVTMKMLRVYPNPVVSGEELNLMLSNFKGHESITIHLFDMMGTPIKTINTTTSADGTFKTSLQLPRSMMPKFYVVRVVSAKAVTEAKITTQ